MKYTIINTEKRTAFIQEKFDTVKEAEKKLAVLKAKNADRYPIAIVGVDDEGNYHELNEQKTEETKTV